MAPPNLHPAPNVVGLYMYGVYAIYAKYAIYAMYRGYPSLYIGMCIVEGV